MVPPKVGLGFVVLIFHKTILVYHRSFCNRLIYTLIMYRNGKIDFAVISLTFDLGGPGMKLWVCSAYISVLIISTVFSKAGSPSPTCGAIILPLGHRSGPACLRLSR